MDTDYRDAGLTPVQQDQSPVPSRWPWLVGGFAVGLGVGVAVARPVMATRGFFRAPGWGWAAAETVAHTVLRTR